MSTTVSVSHYEYQGQVYSPAFSEPLSPLSTTSSTSSNPSSPRSKRRDFDDCENEDPFEYSSKAPKYANKYEEMLQPLSPVTMLPLKFSKPLPLKTHLRDIDEKYRCEIPMERYL